jgi:hypothetical protein
MPVDVTQFPMSPHYVKARGIKFRHDEEAPLQPLCKVAIAAMPAASIA